MLPKLKWVRAELHRKPLHWWRLVYATVSRAKSGKYFYSLLYEYEEEEKRVAPRRVVGVNRDRESFYIDSEGRSPEPPRTAEEKLAELRRGLSRMEKGSKNYQQQLRRIQLLHEHIANQRKDFIHKESRRLADEWDAVSVTNERLTGRANTEGFGRFRDCLRYKLEREGKTYLTVSEKVPEGVEGAERVKELGMAQLPGKREETE